MPTTEEIKKAADAAELKTIVDAAVAAAKAESSAELAKSVAALKRENAILKMAPAHKAYFDGLSGDPADPRLLLAIEEFIAKSDDERAEAVAKHAASKKIDPEIQKKLDRLDEVEKRAAKLEEASEVAKFEKKAAALGLHATHGEVLRKAYAGDAAAQAKLDELIKGLAAQVATGVVFKELGTNRGGGTTAREQMDSMAAELRKTDSSLTKEEAFTKVYTDPANRELVKTHKQEIRAPQRA